MDSTHLNHASSPQRIRRRLLGSYYTPEPIVRYMLRSCFDGPLRERLSNAADPLRILDPACGDGVFLLAAVREIAARNSDVDLVEPGPGGDESRLVSIDRVARHVFGVDVDADAILALRRRIGQAIGPAFAVDHGAEELVGTNFRVGDALTGPDFHTVSQTATHRGGRGSRRAETIKSSWRSAAQQELRPPKEETSNPGGIDWSAAFPQVAKAGGFDLVVGNPPYRSEKGAERLFRRLAETDLWRRRRQPRMDLWHYFLHRGLDLLRPGGVLCYIINSYWMSARSAEPMIARLRNETTVRQVVLFGDAPIFDGVSGRHMILQVQKRRTDSPCRVIDLSEVSDSSLLSAELASYLEEDSERSGKRVHSIAQDALYQGNRFMPRSANSVGPSADHTPLGDVLDIRQGIAENPPFVTRAIRDEIGNGLEIGAGIFVLTADEIAALGLSPHERQLLRPYYAVRAIGRYEISSEPTHRLLYLTRRTAPNIERLPNIAMHLGRVRPVLERRREVRRKTIAWWHLHWPREERLFVEPRILAVQMCRRPRFVYVERPTFVGFSVNLVRQSESPRLSLPAATAVLNSGRAAAWFNGHAKRRGAALDISGTLLRQFPLPSLAAAVQERLAMLCLRRQQIAANSETGCPWDNEQACEEIEREIGRIVWK